MSSPRRLRTPSPLLANVALSVLDEHFAEAPGGPRSTTKQRWTRRQKGLPAPDAGHAPYAGEIKRISATDPETVVFELCRPDVAFLSKIASPAFAINDAGWLASHIDPAATGPQAIVDQVNGTGPYRLESWTHGSEVSLARNDGYWGDKAANERFIARWYDNAGQRIAELQNASVDGVDDIDPTAVQAVTDDTDLKLAPRPGLDVFYAGFTDTFAPFDNELVRRAIATGIDRQHIVDTYFPPGSELATQYTPCEIPHGCGGDAWYGVRPDAGQGDAGVGRFSGRLRHEDPVQRNADRVPARPDGRRNRAQEPASRQPRDPSRAPGRPGRHLPRRRQRGQARRYPSARPERDLPRRRGVPRGALRVRRVT